MTFEYLADPSGRPAWDGVLPGKPEPFFLSAGEGEHSRLFGDHFSVLLSGDETENQFGMILANCPKGDLIPAHTHAGTHETFFVVEGKIRLFVEMEPGEKVSRLLLPGDFAYVPAGHAHAYQVEEAGKMLGTISGGFERFFQHMGTLTDRIDPATPPFIPPFERMQAAAEQHNMSFHPGFEWPEPSTDA
ncbi:quercetin 2,3-dioxygenase [Nocardioides insulae]|uniref:quercetin 2,3-dioxygenase n=1 Tax=Nocardioides insulae TaxID=394734 RepID=UPI00049001EF|nr:quercetin 2,3-dioxygenase [Nocardioides insulae]